MAACSQWLLLLLSLTTYDIGINAEDKMLWWTSDDTDQNSLLCSLTGEPDDVLRQLRDQPNITLPLQYSFFNNSGYVFGSVAVDTRTPRSIFVHDKTSGRIYNFRKNEGTLSSLVARSSKLVEDIAVDWVSQNLYYTDPMVGICLVSYKTNHHNIIIPSVAALRGVDVDPIAGFLFYADADTGHIYKADLTGQEHRILSGAQTTRPTYLVADSASMTVYWLDGSQELQSWHYGGNGFKVIWSNYLIGTGWFGGITIYNNYLYLPLSTKSKMLVVLTNGSLLQEFHTIDLETTNGIAISATAKQPPTPSVCSTDNGGCDHICTHKKSSTRQCLCQYGYSLQPDGATCKTEMLSDNFLLFADIDGIYQMSLTTDEVRAVPLPAIDNGRPDDVTYDPVDKYIYWTERKLGAIWRINTDTHNANRFFNLNTGAVCQGIVMDPIGRALYYADAGSKLIGRIQVTNMQHDVLVKHTEREKPIGVQLDINRGHIYWSEWGTSPTIERADITDGMNRQVLVNSQLVQPTSIALDLKASHLYWVDLALERLERADLTGANRKVLLATPAGTIGCTLDTEFIYVGAKRVVQRIRKSDLSVRNVGPEYFLSIFGLTYYSSSETEDATVTEYATVTPTDKSPTNEGKPARQDDTDTGISQTVIIIISGVGGGVVLLVIVIVVAVILVRRRNNRSVPPSEGQKSATAGSGPPSGPHLTSPRGGLTMMAHPGGAPIHSENISDIYLTTHRDPQAQGTHSYINQSNPLNHEYDEIMVTTHVDSGNNDCNDHYTHLRR